MTAVHEQAYDSGHESADDARSAFEEIIRDITSPPIRAAREEFRAISDDVLQALEDGIREIDSRNAQRLRSLGDAVGDVAYLDPQEESLAGLILRVHGETGHAVAALEGQIGSARADAEAALAAVRSDLAESRDASSAAGEKAALDAGRLLEALVEVDRKSAGIQDELRELTTVHREQAEVQQAQIRTLEVRLRLLVALLATLIVAVPVTLAIV